MMIIRPPQQGQGCEGAWEAKVLIDGCQAAPRLPVDVQALGYDFYAFSGHKTYGPTGIGVLTVAMSCCRRCRPGKAAARWSSASPASPSKRPSSLAKAKEFKAKRDHAAERDPNFDFAEALFQIAIVLESVSIVAASRSLVKLSGVLAAVGTLLMLNGYFLLVHLPFEWRVRIAGGEQRVPAVIHRSASCAAGLRPALPQSTPQSSEEAS
jgi:hypothetical protein